MGGFAIKQTCHDYWSGESVFYLRSYNTGIRYTKNKSLRLVFPTKEDAFYIRKMLTVNIKPKDFSRINSPLTVVQVEDSPNCRLERK